MDKPDAHFEIDHVYGFSGGTACLYFGKDKDEIVFKAATIGVVQDLTTREQKFFGSSQKEKMQKKQAENWKVHQDEISGIHVCTGARNIVATGEQGPMSTVHIWDTSTMKSIASFSLGAQAKGIAALGLSPCHRYVACVDSSKDHQMTIYNVQKRQIIL
jgi:WD40 repeat protein